MKVGIVHRVNVDFVENITVKVSINIVNYSRDNIFIYVAMTMVIVNGKPINIVKNQVENTNVDVEQIFFIRDSEADFRDSVKNIRVETLQVMVAEVKKKNINKQSFVWGV